tara:strand:+ start:7660 stop:9639 length:1980 start_codon:yes stop_codon:yes gene_type:complete
MSFNESTQGIYSPCYELAICCIVKNEGLDISEWIAFHWLQGVEHFFIFDNGSTDTTRAEIGRFPSSIYTLINWPQRPGQQAAYQYALTRFRSKSKWMAFIDADEYLFCPDGKDLRVQLKGYADYSGVGAHWCIYGSAGVRDKGEKLAIDAFQQRAPLECGVNRHIKSIVQPSQTLGALNTPHIFVTRGAIVNEQREPLSPFEHGIDPHITHERFRINHYVVKDQRNWIIKQGNGLASAAMRRKESFRDAHDRNDVHDPVLSKSMSAVRAVLDALPPTGDPQLFDSHRDDLDLHFDWVELEAFISVCLPHSRDPKYWMKRKGDIEAFDRTLRVTRVDTAKTHDKGLLFFVHIPKTAGTSLRLAAAQYFGSSAIGYDYGADSVDTSDLINEWIYKKNDCWGFAQAAQNQKLRFVSGHVNADKYNLVAGCHNVATVLRDPVQRLLSEYQHFVRHHGYKDDFRSFFTKPQFTNRQSKILERMPLSAIGVLGVTERYDDFLALLNTRYDLDIPRLEANLGKQQLSEMHPVEDDDLVLLNELNAADFKLYQEAVANVETRWQFFKQAKPWVHGHFGGANTRKAFGWAWWDRSDEPVEIEIRINGRVAGVARASEFRPHLHAIGAPRGGYVGFSLPIEAAVGDPVSCMVVDTGQLLTPDALRVKAC